MKKKMFIVMQGVSGSGKSTLAQRILEEDQFEDGTIVCSDYWFENEDTGEYTFDATQIDKAHAYCFSNCLDALNDRLDVILVDNTNTTTMEVAPYMLAVAATNIDSSEDEQYEAVILRVPCDDLDMAAGRNLHGVPLRGIQQQANRIRAFDNQNFLKWPVKTAEEVFAMVEAMGK